MIQPAFEILNQRGTPMFFSDTFSNIPTAGIVGRIFIRTDSPYGIYRDTGSTWEQIAGSGGGGISGSGVAGQVTFWDGTSSVSGSNNLWFDNASGKFLVGTNNTTGAAKLQVTSATGDDQLRVWGATSPSIRIDNAVTGATQRFVMGLATATNNFIQGSAAGNICISTASANPLLFGMWQTTNASEVMRISTANNLLIGTTTDSGQKLQITGNGAIIIGGNEVSVGEQRGLVLQTSTTSKGSIELVLNNTFTTTGKTWRIRSLSGGDFDITSAIGSRSIYIASGGQVVINGSSPVSSAQFGVVGVTAINGGLQVQGGLSSPSGAGFEFEYNGSSCLYTSYNRTSSTWLPSTIRASQIDLQNSGTTNLRLSSAGNVLIGTTTDAGFKLDIQGTLRSNGNVRLQNGSGVDVLRTAAFDVYVDNGSLLSQFLQVNRSITNNSPRSRTVIDFSPIGNSGNQQSLDHSYLTFSATGTYTQSNGAAYTHALFNRGTLANYTSYRAIDVQNMDTFLGSTSGSVGIGATYTISSSAIFQITSTTQGFLPPRMTTTQINAIASPAEGLVVYNTTLSHLCCYQAGAWVKFSHTPM